MHLYIPATSMFSWLQLSLPYHHSFSCIAFFSYFNYGPLLSLLSIVSSLFLKLSSHSYFLSTIYLFFIIIYFTELGFFNLLDSIFADYKEKDVTADKKTEEQILDFVSKIEPIFIFCLIWWVKSRRDFCINMFQSICWLSSVMYFVMMRIGWKYDFLYERRWSLKM